MVSLAFSRLRSMSTMKILSCSACPCVRLVRLHIDCLNAFGCLLVCRHHAHVFADCVGFRYEVRLTEGLDCGGAYLKMLAATPNFDPKQLDSSSPYIIMFGPDKCGATNKVRHK